MKRCRVCGEMKPLDAFYAMAGMRDGHRNECKACNLAAKAARYRANPEPAKRRAREWALAHPDRVRAQIDAKKASGAKARNDRRYHLKRKYGITPEDYDRMLAEQGGVCAICKRVPRDDISLHVDHNPATGAIRGLLCFLCNNALGDFGDDARRLARAPDYLALHEAPDEVALARARAYALKRAA